MQRVPGWLALVAFLAGALSLFPGCSGGSSDRPCSAGRFGPGCEPCACLHGTCDDGRSGTGACTSCDAGWTGANCDACAAGAYGAACTVANYAFVSSTGTSGDMGGPEGADAICNGLAAAAGLPGTFVAWLSTSSVNARDRLGSARGWIRTDGLPFADTIDQALSNPWYPLRLDEFGEKPPTLSFAYLEVATGSDATGAFAGTGLDCEGWTSTSGSGQVGVADEGGNGWSSDHTAMGCDSTSLRLLCLGVDHANPLALEPAPGRTAFLSAGTFAPGGGLGTADALCQAEAADAGLTGTYLAFLATEEASASSRFALDGAAWVRPDRVAVVASAGDIAGPELLAPIDVHADGTVGTWTDRAWTGSWDAAAAGVSSTCADWRLTAGGSGKYGTPWWAALPWVGGWYQPCDPSYALHLYCLQE